MDTQTKTTNQNDGKVNRVLLPEADAEQIVKILNVLLSDYQIFYQNLRGLHWNIKGPHFFTLHSKFEAYYDSAADNVDTIAERILTLGSVPFHSFQDYLDHGHLEAVTNVQEDRKAVETILHNMQHLIGHLRQTAELTAKLGDDATNDMSIEMLRELEKDTWMLEAWLK